MEKRKIWVILLIKCEKLPPLDRVDSHQGVFVLHLSKSNEFENCSNHHHLGQCSEL